MVAHTDPVSVPGWSREGYVILDPQTGDGAYQIEGGTNGGYAYAEPASLVAHVGATVGEHELGENVVSSALDVFKSAMTVVSIGETFSELLNYCGPAVAAAVTALITVINYFLDLVEGFIEASLAATGVGLIASIVLIMCSWLYQWLVDQFIEDLTEQLCQISEWSDPVKSVV